MSDDGKVLFPNFGEGRLTVDRTTGPGHCAHHYVVLRTRTREVICRACKSLVDPFVVLAELAHNWEWATHYGQEIDERSRRIEKLKAEESSLKAKVKKGYRSSAAPRAALYFDELVRKFAAVETFQDIQEVRMWAHRFPWLDQKQVDVLKEAEKRADERARKNTRRRRHLDVVPEAKETKK